MYCMYQSLIAVITSQAISTVDTQLPEILFPLAIHLLIFNTGLYITLQTPDR